MFYSLSRHPGNTGEYYYNTMFKKLNMPYKYTALACNSLEEHIDRLRISSKGFSVSMPFKEKIFDYLDVVDPLAATYSTVNTVLVKDERLLGYTNDYFGALFLKDSIPTGYSVLILGDGSMGQLISRVLGNTKIVSRRLGNWEERYQHSDVIINCTSYGTSTTESPFYIVPTAKLVFDLAIKDNQLKHQCAAKNIKYIPGIEFYKHQFIHQFQSYTGVKVDLCDFENIQK